MGPGLEVSECVEEGDCQLWVDHHHSKPRGHCALDAASSAER